MLVPEIVVIYIQTYTSVLKKDNDITSQFISFQYLKDFPEGCNQALGMQSGNITDEQITASDSVYFNPHDARLNNTGNYCLPFCGK